MSDALDKVRSVKELPLFPLPVVLFPGVPLPRGGRIPRFEFLRRRVPHPARDLDLAAPLVGGQSEAAPCIGLASPGAGTGNRHALPAAVPKTWFDALKRIQAMTAKH